MTRRDVNEGDVFRKGFATNALESGATTGQVPKLAADGQVEFGDAGGGSQPITRAQYDVALTDVPDGTPTKMPFIFNYGTALLDLTDPTNPTPVESGTYAFASTVSISNTSDVTTGWFLSLLLDENDFAPLVLGAELRGSGYGSQLTLPLTFYVPTGSPCWVTVQHNDSGMVSFTGHVYVQRLS